MILKGVKLNSFQTKFYDKNQFQKTV